MAPLLVPNAMVETWTSSATAWATASASGRPTVVSPSDSRTMRDGGISPFSSAPGAAASARAR
ncbi:MAG: hypothetical protein R2710_04945 [Acidimicrobiales bacterium]